MKKFCLLFILLYSLSFANGKPKLIILDFVNQTEKSPHYDLLSKKIGDEFRFIFSKSEKIELVSLDPLYFSLLNLQKQGKLSSYKKIIHKIQLYLNSKKQDSFDYLLAGEFLVSNGNLELVYRLYQNGEALKPLLEKRSSQQAPFEKISHWQFHTCLEALGLANSYFRLEIYDSYTKKCKEPNKNSEILENSLSIYKEIQFLERELFLSDSFTERKICVTQCYNEKQETKVLQCLNSCDSNYIENMQKIISKIQLKGYKKLNENPENLETTWKNFQKEFLDLVVFILKSLPEGYKLSIQGRIGKEFSSHPKIFEISKQKSENVKERLTREILALDKNYVELTDKLYSEGCADLCFAEYPNQFDENSVTFRIRKQQ